MKFTKEDAFESLKRELTNNGRKTLRMSEKSLDKLTETLMGKFADDETGLPDFVTNVKDLLETFNSNIEKDRSDFIKQWKEEHPDTDPPKSTETPKNEENENPEMKALLERIAALEKDKEENAKKANIAQKRKDVIAKLKEKGIKDDEWVNNFLSEVNITEDLDVDAKADSWLKLYNKSQASGGNPAVSGNPQGNGQNNPYADAIKAAGEIAKRERAVIEQK